MKQLYIALVAIGFVAVLEFSAQAQDSINDYWYRLHEAREIQDWDSVILNARILRTNEGWPDIPTQFQGAILTYEGEALYRNQDYGGAREQLERALSLSVSEQRAAPLYWLMWVEGAEENFPRVAAILLELHEINPDQINSLRYRFLNLVLLELESAGEIHLYEQMLAVLLTDYSLWEPVHFKDWWVTRNIERLLGRGEIQAAMAELDKVLFSSARIRIRTSSDFEALWLQPGFDEMTDPVAGEEATLERAMQRAESHPLSLSLVGQQVRSLTRLGRLEEATGLAENAIQQLEDGEPFEDADARATWIMNELAIRLYAQNRREEANQWMERSTTLSESGNTNVSQVINYATMLMLQGEHEQALRTLEGVGRPSDYGEMWIQSVRACSGHQLGRTEVRDEALNRLEDGWGDNPPAYQRALLCLDEMDAAAELMLDRLAATPHRNEAITAMQNRPLLIGREVMPLADVIDARFTALKQRPDLQAAATEHGRIETIDLYEAYLGSF